MRLKKDELIARMPDRLFVLLANRISSARIRRTKNMWTITKDGITLWSPTPKFIGFGQEVFRQRYLHHYHPIPPLVEIVPGDTVMDIGASIGDTTIPMCRLVGPTGTVIAVEPHPINYHFLKLNVQEYGNAQCIQKAAWSSPGKMVLHIGREPTGHSLVWENYPDWIGSEEIETQTINQLADGREIQYCKIDAQGAEVEILKGDCDKVRTFAIATHGYGKKNATSNEVIETLKSKGYEPILEHLAGIGVVYAWRKTN